MAYPVHSQACLVISRVAACSKNSMKSEDLSQFLSWSISNLGSQVRMCVVLYYMWLTSTYIMLLHDY